jgi:hypothetical protein
MPQPKCALILLGAALCASAAAPPPATWYMKETAMTSDGRLTFLDKPWWPRAQSLQEGESFTMDLNRDGRPDTMVIRKDGNIIEAIDDSGRAQEIWNQVSTCYVVSYKGTGVVDRMVIYIDNDGDGKADEQELRHFQDGYLRYAWFGENYDKDGVQIFDLKNWHYAGNNGKNKFRGNLQIYLNKYDPKTKTWVPLSECPFAFWDPNKDGHGDVVFRVSAAPLSSLTGPDSDYANNYNYMWAPEATPLEKTGNLNVRFSFNIDPGPRKDPLDKPHYNFGFTSVGSTPYQYPNMRYTNPKRRAPQTVTRIAWDQGISVGMNYPAKTTGFTWDESRSVWRWEGQFWIFERIYLSNTGGPTWRWNMRREYSPKPAARREIYYSAADKRYHLTGAAEGWMEVGQLVNQQKDLEFRWYDRDGDGKLDTVEVFQPGKPLPVRVSRFDPRARPAPLNRARLAEEYNQRILPQAIAENERFIEAVKRVAASPLADAYIAEAGKAEMAERRRYCLDIARELLFLQARETLLTRDAENPYPESPLDRTKYKSMDKGSKEKGYSMGDSMRYWEMARAIDQFTDQYANGRLDEAVKTLAEIVK